jgi:hypothetical protein
MVSIVFSNIAPLVHPSVVAIEENAFIIIIIITVESLRLLLGISVSLQDQDLP